MLETKDDVIISGEIPLNLKDMRPKCVLLFIRSPPTCLSGDTGDRVPLAFHCVSQVLADL